MAETRSIESYVLDLCQYIDAWDYENMNNVYETLLKMRASFKEKHYLNYWRVLQCVGEVGADKLIYLVAKSPVASCKKHNISNLVTVMELFSESLSTVAFIKRVNHYKSDILPVVFTAIEQREYPELVRKGFVALYRMIIVGKTTLVTPYMKHGILRNIYQQIKCQQGVIRVDCVETVSYCAKLIAALLQLGDEETRRSILKSNIPNELDVYVVRLKKSKVNWEEVDDVLEFYDQAKMSFLLGSDSKPEDWNSKDKLIEELKQDLEVFIFCSSPPCRKIQADQEKFLYCGQCKLSRYCSPGCQREHWKLGHKEMCLHGNGPKL